MNGKNVSNGWKSFWRAGGAAGDAQGTTQRTQRGRRKERQGAGGEGRCNGVADGAATAGRGRGEGMCAVVHARAFARNPSQIIAAHKSQYTPKTTGALRSFSCKPTFKYRKGRTK